MAKWKKKLRKIAKKAIPAIGLGLAATALARKRATDAPGDAYAKAKRLLTSDDAYAPKMPAHLTHTMGATGPRSQIGMGHPIIRGNIERSSQFLKKGGRVTGIAKRGFGRALRKGKK